MHDPEPAVQVAANSMTLQTEAITVNATGAVGADTTVSGMFVGQIVDVYIDYGTTMSNTTDLTLSFYSPLAMGNVLAVTDNATDGLYAPRLAPVSNAAAAIANSYVPFYVNGTLLLSVGQTLSGTTATAYVRYVK
jgi:hypothetical protein